MGGYVFSLDYVPYRGFILYLFTNFTSVVDAKSVVLYMYE